VSKHSQLNFFLPTLWEVISDRTIFYGWDFLRPLIGRNIFWASVNWQDCGQKNLPKGYSGYVVKTEGPNVEWIEKQAHLVDAPIFICQLYKDYGTFDHLPNVHFIPTIEWHYQFDQMQKVYDAKVEKNPQYKFSALCHRATQSKILVLTTLAQYIGLEQCLVSLHNVQEKGVHYWQKTNNPVVDQCMQYFLENFKDKNILIDDFNNNNKLQVYNFHHSAYTDAAINITNESFHYSYMIINNKEVTLPGPFITEKTLKCIMSETAFINNAQFDTYVTLMSLGFKFDYGFNLEYDNDSGNISRMIAMLDLVKTLCKINTQDLYEQTRDSCVHNKEYVMSGDFYRTSEAINQRGIETILSKL